jgi:hypothetical protein
MTRWGPLDFPMDGETESGYIKEWSVITDMFELWDLETFPPLPRMMAMIQHRNMDDGAISSSKGARSGPAGST